MKGRKWTRVVKEGSAVAIYGGYDELHVPPCSTRFQERVFDPEMRYHDRNLCRCCGRLMAGRRIIDADTWKRADPLCARCERSSA